MANGPCNTVRIKNPDNKNEVIVINESDYNPKIHKLVKGEVAPAVNDDEQPDEPETPAIESIDDLGKLTKEQLFKLAEEYQVLVPAGSTKATLIEEISASLFADNDEE